MRPLRPCLRLLCPRPRAWLLGLVLLVGLTACGSPAPDLPVAGPATGSAGTSRVDLAVSTPAGQAPTQPTPPASASDGRRPEAFRSGSSVPDSRVPPPAASPGLSPSDVRAEADQVPREARQLWLAELRESTDAPVRLHALNLWAQEPDDDDLEPLFEALGDDDEAVQARAEEVWEEQLARADSVP